MSDIETEKDSERKRKRKEREEEREREKRQDNLEKMKKELHKNLNLDSKTISSILDQDVEGTIDRSNTRIFRPNAET